MLLHSAASLQDVSESENACWTVIADLPTDASDGEEMVCAALPTFLANMVT